MKAKDIRVRTTPTKKQEKEMSTAIKKLFETFSPLWLAQKTELSISTFYVARNRGKVGVGVATLICEIDEVREAGFTREMLRPDVSVQQWEYHDFV